MTNSDMDGPPRCPLTGLPIWDEGAVMARLSAALYRHFGPYNTAEQIRAALGRDSPRTPKAWLLRDQSPTLATYVRLCHTPGCGDPFSRAVRGLPEDPELARALILIEEVKRRLLTRGGA